MSGNDFDLLNEKLDRILEILEPTTIILEGYGSEPVKFWDKIKEQG